VFYMFFDPNMVENILGTQNKSFGDPHFGP